MKRLAITFLSLALVGDSPSESQCKSEQEGTEMAGTLSYLSLYVATKVNNNI